MTDLAGAIESSIRGAWSAHALNPPHVEVDGQARGPASCILIHRHLPGTAESEPGVLHICRNFTELPVQPVELQYLDCRSWRLFNGGESDVRVSTANELIGVVPPGKTLEVAAQAFRVRVRTQFFDFRVSQAEPQSLDSLKIEPLAQNELDRSMTAFLLQIGDLPCHLRAGEGFWAGLENVREKLLIDVWRRFCGEIGAAELPEIRFPPAVDPVPGPGQIAFRVEVRRAGKAWTLIFLAPAGLAGLIRHTAARSADVGAQWTFLAVAGEQSLPLGRLRRLKTGSVVLLDENPSLHEAVTGKSWALVRTGPDSRQLIVGKPIACFLELEAASMAVPPTYNPSTPAPPAIDSVEVRVQAVVSSERVPFSELGRYLPGQNLPVEFSPGKSVDIYVNGRKLGLGKLVEIKLPGRSGLGLQVVSWDV
jgi:flagellar motor switch/type III secretory pathway protein FliN